MSYFLTTMNFYYWKEGNKVIVQNMVGGYSGQKHEHTPEDFQRWIKEGNIKEENLIELQPNQGGSQ